MVTLDEALARHPGAGTVRFGNLRGDRDRLLAMIRDGHRTAASTALDRVEADGASLPETGRRDIALDWDGAPALVVETTSVTICPFDEVAEEFALAEGDSLGRWRKERRAAFEVGGGWSPSMAVVCERFRLVEVFA